MPLVFTDHANGYYVIIPRTVKNYPSQRLKIKLALVPPKPKELHMA